MKKQRNLFIESLKYNTKDFYNSDASRLQAKQKITGSIVDDISHISSNLSMHVTELQKNWKKNKFCTGTKCRARKRKYKKSLLFYNKCYKMQTSI